MTSVSVKPVSTVPTAIPQSAVSPADRSHTHEVSAAVARLNEAGFAGPGREIAFSLDPATKQPVVRVIEADTKEVVSQWPSDHVLALAAEYGNK